MDDSRLQLRPPCSPYRRIQPFYSIVGRQDLSTKQLLTDLMKEQLQKDRPFIVAQESFNGYLYFYAANNLHRSVRYKLRSLKDKKYGMLFPFSYYVIFDDQSCFEYVNTQDPSFGDDMRLLFMAAYNNKIKKEERSKSVAVLKKHFNEKIIIVHGVGTYTISKLE